MEDDEFDERGGGVPAADEDGGLGQINGGLLDPRSFAMGGPGGAPASGAPDSSGIQGGLLDPATFPTPAAEDAGPVLSRQSPALAGPLDRRLHTEDFGWLQAPDGALLINGQRHSVLAAQTFDPSLSAGLSARPRPDQAAAAVAGLSHVAVSSGGPEKGAYLVDLPQPPRAEDVDPKTGLVSSLRFEPTMLWPKSAKAGGNDEVDTLTYTVPPIAGAGIHGHIDQASEGFVDSTKESEGYGDTKALSRTPPIPMATVFRGKVGWHILDGGQLKFVYPEGSMTADQIKAMQDNLDREQLKFQRTR